MVPRIYAPRDRGVFLYYKEESMLKSGVIGIILEYLIVFIIIFIINYFLYIRKKKRLNKNKVPVELYYLVSMYKLDIKKIKYKKFLWIYSFINTFIVSTIYIIVVYLVEGFLWQLLIGTVLLILLIIICYGLLGRYYQKKEGIDNV